MIHQLPGEPRFGMDVTFSPDDDASTPITGDDLAWSPLCRRSVVHRHDATSDWPLLRPVRARTWSQWGTDSARMASILYQRPVMTSCNAKRCSNETT